MIDSSCLVLYFPKVSTNFKPYGPNFKQNFGSIPRKVPWEPWGSPGKFPGTSGRSQDGPRRVLAGSRDLRGSSVEVLWFLSGPDIESPNVTVFIGNFACSMFFEVLWKFCGGSVGAPSSAAPKNNEKSRLQAILCVHYFPNRN